MLTYLRRKKNSLKWIFWLLILVLGAGMLLLFVDTPAGGPSGLGNHVAVVDEDTITVAEFQRGYRVMLEAYQRQFGERLEEFLPQLRLSDQVINSLINEYSIGSEARRLGIEVPDQEVVEQIASFPAFKDPDTGAFVGSERYRHILHSFQTTPTAFEASVRRQLLGNKLLSLLTSGIEPSFAEVRQKFVKDTGRTRIRYVYFDTEIPATETPEPEELQQFFQENQQQFAVPEKRKTAYLNVPVKTDGVELSQEAIQARVAEIPETDRVRASHILFKVEPNESDVLAREKAQQVLEQLKAGEDFAELARQVSEDTSTDDGGDLGFFGRGMMHPEFERVAFELEPGQFSDPVRTPFGIHLIKNTAKPRTSEQARRTMAEFQLRSEEAERLARERADAILGQVKTGTGFQEIAAKEPDLEVGETDFFSLSEDLESLQVRADYNQQIFALAQDELAGPYAAAQYFVISRLLEVEPAYQPPLEDIRDQVLAEYQQVGGSQLAEENADHFYRAVLDSGSFTETTEQWKLEPVTTRVFSAGDNVDDTLKVSSALHERVYLMSEGETSPPIIVAGKLIVFEVFDRAPLDEELFAEQQSEISDSLKQEQRQSFFTAYLQKVVDRLHREEKITVNRELLDTLSG